MTLSTPRQYKIYLDATMGYGLGSENPEEIASYQKIQNKMKYVREIKNIRISRKD